MGATLHFRSARGYSTADAQDIVQGFFAHLLEHNTLSRADQEKGPPPHFPARFVTKFFAQAAGTDAEPKSAAEVSPRDPALLALARLPVAVPFHSIIGENHNSSETDGVVRYASSHLDGTRSELIVRSGHNVLNDPAARAK